jgi:hypothetical protein
MAGVVETRPLAASKEAFLRLLSEREAIYAQVATVRIVNDEARSAGEVATEIARLAEPGRPGRDAAPGERADGERRQGGAS